MRNRVRSVCYLLIVASIGTQSAMAQEQTSRRSRSEMEDFLQKAKITSHKALGSGVTNSDRATLSDGTLVHDAHVQSIDEQKDSFKTATRGVELNFKDSYKFNIAAYRLDKILSLNMIPVSVERKFAGKTSAITWWVDDVMMDEMKRKAKNLDPPDRDAWNKQMYVVRVFDQLIYNTDRNLGNLLIDKNWRLWMIDHTRAFRMMDKLQNDKNLVMCDRTLLANLRKLDAETLEAQLRPFLNKTEIKAVLQRRDVIVKFFDQAVATRGEGAVLYDLPPRE
jgi:hypothetical protein